MAALAFDPIRLPPECEALRHEVRAFLAEEIAAGTFDPSRPGHGDSQNRAFSQRIGAKGWIGMTWPKKYGGHERSFLERYVVTEEFRVANAPVRLHFVADRQSGPILMKFAPETGEIFDYYQVADVFVCTSFEESFPRVLLESAAFRRLIVSTDVNGIAEMINPDEAWLMPPGDRYRLAEGLKAALAAHFAGDRARAEKARATVLHKYHEAQSLPQHALLARAAAQNRL